MSGLPLLTAHEACCSFDFDSGGSFVGTVCAVTCLGAWGVPRGTDSVDLLSVTRLCAPQRHTCSFSCLVMASCWGRAVLGDLSPQLGKPEVILT